MAEGVNRLDLPVVEEQLFQVKKKKKSKFNSFIETLGILNDTHSLRFSFNVT